jgi:glycosyltransferase involved in cell wall biosynthesis
MSLAVPLIVSDRGGLPELIEEGDCGIICPPEAGPLTESLQSLMQNDARRLTMAENALRTYERYHTPEAYLASYLGLAERILKDRA